MLARTGRPRAALAFAVLLLLLLAPAAVQADTVTLYNGGEVHGHLVAFRSASKLLELRTSGGGVIVFPQDTVKHVERAAESIRKTTGARRSASKRQMTAKEEAWMPKVRTLVSQLASGNSDRIRRAKSDLLRIDDPDALPALARFLTAATNAQIRGIFVSILRNVNDPKTVNYLVLLSMYDPDAQLRDKARKAIGPKRADAARPFYIECLRSGEHELIGRAAQGVGEIGDPHGQSVPDLIEALAEQGTQYLVIRGAPLLYSDCIDEQIEAMRDKLVAVPRPEGRAEVLDALNKITDQPYPNFGYNVAAWRTWWETEKTNRNPPANARDHSNR